jgi:hypothetical protein
MDWDAMWGWRYGVPNYRLWLESAGPDFPYQDWSISVNSSSRGWSYGANGGVFVISGRPLPTPPAEKWLRVNLDALPPSSIPNITVKFTSKNNSPTIVLDIPNPAYVPHGK